MISVIIKQEDNKASVITKKTTIPNDKIVLPIKQEGEIFYCDQCNYQTGRKGDLRKHRQSKHEGITYACGKCEYQPKDRSSLRKHKKAVHEGVRYPCDQCVYKTVHWGVIMHQYMKSYFYLYIFPNYKFVDDIILTQQRANVLSLSI